MSEKAIRILLTEDEEAHVEAIRRSLLNKDSKYNIFEAKDLRTLKKILAKAEYDIVLTDMNLPDGQAFGILEPDFDKQKFPVIIMTAYGDEESAVKAIKMGAYDYIVKSDSMFIELPRIVDRVLKEWKNEKKRRQAEIALHESEERFKRLADNAQDVIYRMSIPDGKYEYVNNAVVQILGYTPDELYKGRLMISKIIHPDWKEYFEKQWSDLIRGIMPPTYEFQIIHKNGKEAWCHQRNILVKDDQGKPIAIEGIITDITARKQAENALRESEMRMSQIIDFLPDATFAINTRGEIILWNKAIVEMTGRTADDMLGKGDHEYTIPFYGERRFALIDFVFNDSELYHKKYSYIRKTGNVLTAETVVEPKGKEISVWATAVPLYDARGKIIGAIESIRDITELRKAEEERLDLERRILHVQKLESMGVLAGGIAHDFNNILMAVLGHAELALGELPPLSAARDNLMEIEKAAHRASDLSRQMLAYSGKGKFVISKIKLGDLVNELMNLLEASISKKVVLKLNLDKNLPLIEGDATQIRQVIMNLITNASEAIGEASGMIVLSTGLKECKSDYLQTMLTGDAVEEGLFVYLEVSDTGCGMDEQTVNRIFEPFFTTKFTGRGLGMSAVLGIVRGHQGAIKIDTKAGQGTTFKVFFPALEEPIGIDEQGNNTISDEWKAKGLVLLVDDEDGVRVVGKRMLEKIGFSVLLASNGQEALKSFRERHEDIVLVILDLTMPLMDGEETYRELSKDFPDAKVMISSGYSEQEISTRFENGKLAGFIQKPFSLEELSKITKMILGK